MIPFAKYHGAGNDFVVIDDRGLKFPSHDASLIARICHRRYGVGADGLILAQTSNVANCKMRIFNADGYEAALCGNGLRCLADFLKEEKDTLRVETMERIVICRKNEFGILVEMGPFRRLFDPHPWGDLLLHGIHTGVPHAVLEVDDLSLVDFEKKARKIRYASIFGKEGANVNFAAKRADGSFSFRTYERGVEAETLACGTGAAAVAVALGLSEILLETAAGERLWVEVAEDNVSVSGPAVFVFAGVIGDFT